MPTASINYAASANTLTWTMTAPASDTNLLAGRQSSSVNNNQTSDEYIDIIVGGTFQTDATNAGAGSIEVYAYGSPDNGTTWTANTGGPDGALTLTSEQKQLLALVAVVTTNDTKGAYYNWGPVSLSAAFGGTLPTRWGLWGVHSANAALDVSTTKWTGVKYDSA